MPRQTPPRRIPPRYWFALFRAYWQLLRARKRYKKMLQKLIAHESRSRMAEAQEPKPISPPDIRDGDGSVMKNGRLLRPTTCAVVKGGAGYPFCSIEHLASWASSRFAPKNDWTLGQSKAEAPYCSHCYWCGKIIRNPELCVVHGDEDCPKFDWNQTLRAGLILEEFRRLTDRSPSESEIAQLQNIQYKNPHLTAFEIVRVIDLDEPTEWDDQDDSGHWEDDPD
jgi:hypothetical protein